MAKSRFEARTDVSLGGDADARELADTPLRIALLGDFSGRGPRSDPRLAGRAPVRIDRDNFDQVLARHDMVLRLTLPGAEEPLAVRFEEMDDFHPDRLFRRLPEFRALRDLLEELRDPTRFPAAAERMRGWASAVSKPAAPPPVEPPPARPDAERADLMEQILAVTREQRPEDQAGGDDLQRFLREAVRPHLLPRIDFARQAELVAVVEGAASRMMRDLLHHPDFQGVEAAWRAAEFLVRRLDTDAAVHLYLLDVTRDELAADLEAAADLSSTALYRVLLDPDRGPPWGLLAGLYTFGHDPRDAVTLAGLAQAAAWSLAPFLAGADSRLLGCESLVRTPDPDDWTPPDPDEAAVWSALRQMPEAAALGLALPRFLLRMPYGPDAAGVESFAFEEMTDPPAHEDYLWGNPAVACVYLIAEAFMRRGWGLTGSIANGITGLPAHSYREDGESQVKPCAEALLGQRAAEAILERGLIPLLSIRDQDALQVARLQSLADPPGDLAGRWK